MPKGWPSSVSQPGENGELVGNDSQGGYVAVHSLAILPEYQRRKLGRSLFSAYIEYVRREIGYAKSIIIIAHDHLLPFYKSLGFEDMGVSECAFGGGGWYDMVSRILYTGSLHLGILIDNVGDTTPLKAGAQHGKYWLFGVGPAWVTCNVF